MIRRAALVAVAGALLVATGCTSSPDPPAESSASEQGPVDPCPAEPNAPDPDRPEIGLRFEIDDDMATVEGREDVRFVPDLETDELVFRLTPNGPGSAQFGNRITVTDVTGDQVEDYGYESADAYPTTDGGLLVIELTDSLAPGTAVEVSIEFELELGDGSFDRFGTAEGVAWWASGFPLLAWEPGVGWDREPFVEILGETSTSVAAATRIEVSAPEEYEVLMTGAPERPERDGDRRIWRSVEPSARDVSVAVGEFETDTAEAGDVGITTGVLPESYADARDLADDAAEIIEEFEQFLGPFPYATLSIPVLPDFGGGIEYPSSILLASPATVVLVHEIAHMWFYGMVGNSQFRDPWLDESFASFAEDLLRDDPDTSDLEVPGDVGDPMTAFADSEEYTDVVYGKGGAMLTTARDAVGADRFDPALRCYLNAQAWQVAVPDDVAVAFADLPEAIEIFTDAGAV